MERNVDRAAGLILRVRARGVSEFCVCAGSRNSPLLAVLAQSDVPLFSFVDERAAAFFAIGRFKLHGQPVAVVTTSGTAAAELLPAAIEAYYSGVPLILITADRPARFRGTGAPQAIEQVGLFGDYAEASIETWSGRRPLHLNIEFDEPLIDGHPAVPETDTAAFAESRSQREDTTSIPLSPSRGDGARVRGPSETSSSKDGEAGPVREASFAEHAMQPERRFGRRPLVIIGGLSSHHHDRVRAFAQRLNAPVYAEPLSGLREDPTLPLVTAGERMLARYDCDSVIRIGNVPTLRFWRDLEHNDLPVTHFSDLPVPGLTRGQVHRIETLPEVGGTRDRAFFAADRESADAFARILDLEPYSELSMIRDLSRELAHGSRVYLGNSLPIREWDLAATREDRGFAYQANRGANGIDGQLSTFFGWCDPSADNVCVVGDLTTIYDLNAPWIVPQIGHKRFRIVVVNNGGGRIFSRVASLRSLDPEVRGRIIENVHDVRFEHWAAMWDIDVTELRPEADASQRVWQRYDELWA